MVEKAIQLYNSGMSVKNIAEKLGVDRHRLSKELKSVGVQIKRTSSKYEYVTDFFSNIDSEEKAYWLGFMYADGYVSDKDSKFELGLKMGDIKHVERFRDLIVPNKPIQIRESNSSCRLSGTNKDLVKALISKGCIPNKTFLLEFPSQEIVPTILLKHFIRGYFDGDGCINIPKNRNSVYLSVLGNEKFIFSMRNYLNKELNLSETSLIQKNKIVEWRKTGTQAVTVLDYLYGDCTEYLDRKYQTYLAYCRP